MNLERFKQGLIATHQPAKTLGLWMGIITLSVICALLIWYGPPVMKALAHSIEANARHTEDGTAQLASIAARVDGILQRNEPKIDQVVSDFADASGSARRMSAGLERGMPALVASMDSSIGQVGRLIADVHAQSLPIVNQNLRTLDINQQKVGAFFDTLPTITNEATRTFTEVRSSPGYVATFGAEGALVSFNRTLHGLEATPAKLNSNLDNLDSLTDSAAMTADDIYKWGHKAMFPDPCKGFWGCAKRGASYLVSPTIDALRIYSLTRPYPPGLKRSLP